MDKERMSQKNRFDLYMGKAEAIFRHYTSDRYGDAKFYLLKALNIYPNNASANKLLARVYFASHQYGKCKTLLDTFRKKQIPMTSMYLKMSRDCSYYNAKREKKQKEDRAIKNNEYSDEQKFEIYISRATNIVNKKIVEKYDQAIDYLRKALLLQDCRDVAKNLLNKIYCDLGYSQNTTEKMIKSIIDNSVMT